MIHGRKNCTVLAADMTPVPNQDTCSISAEEFLRFVHHTSFEVLAPSFHVPGSSVTNTISELSAIYREMADRGETYLKYLGEMRKEGHVHGSS